MTKAILKRNLGSDMAAIDPEYDPKHLGFFSNLFSGSAQSNSKRNSLS